MISFVKSITHWKCNCRPKFKMRDLQCLYKQSFVNLRVGILLELSSQTTVSICPVFLCCIYYQVPYIIGEHGFQFYSLYRRGGTKPGDFIATTTLQDACTITELGCCSPTNAQTTEFSLVYGLNQWLRIRMDGASSLPPTVQNRSQNIPDTAAVVLHW